MSRITFIPTSDSTRSANGWPDKVQGDGFIDLRLIYEEGAGFAVYEDNTHPLDRQLLREEYEFYDANEGEWAVEVQGD